MIKNHQNNHQNKSIKLIVFLFLLQIPCVNSQEIQFNRVLVKEGLNLDFVTGITQDANGLMWFSTKTGLLSYDGHTQTLYKNNPINPNSLVSNFTETVYADNGKIWIGTLGYGLDLFDPKTGKFTHYQHNPDDSTSISNDTVVTILKDKQGILWVGTHGGLNRYDRKRNQFFHYRFEAADSTSLSNNQVRALYEDSQGVLWVGTGSPYADNGGGPEDGGLNRMDKETGTFRRYKHNPENEHSLLNNKISAIYEDDQGILWIGTALNGLHKLDREKESIKRLVYDSLHPEKFRGPPVSFNASGYEHITFITQDKAGSYWVGSIESGINYYNPVLDTTILFIQENGSSPGFFSRGAWGALNSGDGMLWLGSVNGNIYRINPKPNHIPHFSTPSPVNSFYEAENGDLWLATEQKIRLKTHNNNDKAGQFELDATPQNIEDDNVQFLKEDRHGNVWIGGSGGLAMWDKKTEKLMQYKHDPKNYKSLSNNNTLTIYEEDDENLWVGTIDGLNLMNRDDGTFRRFYMNPADTSFIGLNIVTSVLKDSRGKLWVGTWNRTGLYAFNPEENKSKVYIKGISVVCIFEDSRKVIWLGSNNGLFRYDPVSDNFVKYIDPFTISGISVVAGITEDNDNYLWVTTDDGLIRINPQRNKSNKLLKAYGIDNIDFMWNSIYKGRDGKLYLGDATGYYVFDPAEILRGAEPPKIVITGFRLANESISILDDQSPDQLEEIRLSYNQNIFSIDFTIIDYINPDENQLIFTLENFDKNWLQSNSERRAYYFNVPPGEYAFIVRGSNSYGIWAERKIHITILPPWWLTWYAYVMYALLFIALIIGFDRIQRRRIRSIERQKNYQRELTQAKEIKKAYHELKTAQSQLIQSEKMASLGELTAGIAHEIQNPLNFVNNFSEVSSDIIDELYEVIDNNDTDEAKSIAGDLKQNLEKITHHGQRASSIVKGMLEHSRSGTGQKLPTDINTLADEYLRLSYHGLRAKDKSFNADFKTDFDPDLPKIEVIPQNIGRVLLNLINNAFYAVNEKSKKGKTGYLPGVTVSTKRADSPLGAGGSAEEWVKISVADNGKGIPDEIKDKIFQPFFTTKPTGQGTGLGLSMSYDIITKGHGGEIKVNTKKGEGTEFIIHLPLDKK